MYTQFERRGRVAILTLDRPERLNALGRELVKEAKAHRDEFCADPDLWALVITGAGRAFSAGADIKEMAERRAAGDDEPSPFLPKTCWKPVIAAINGIAYGGGLEVAIDCDIRICGRSARFALPEATIGVLPHVGSWKFQRLVPPGVALHHTLTGEPFGAERAREIGFVTRVVEDDSLVDEALALAEQIGQNAPLSVRALSQLWWETALMERDDAVRRTAEVSRSMRGTHDSIEGPASFREKRKPQWRGA
jgi:enoyl-CoA hydratase/carnithine racemase